MDRYTLICRLRGPAYILLTGVIAMMAEWTSIGWGKSWPLYIVLEGVLQLAQRWALSNSNIPPAYPDPYPGNYPGSNPGPYSGPYSGSYPAAAVPVPPVDPLTSTAIVAAPGVVPESPASRSTDWRS